ncbi:S8 family serine peptidase [Pseudofulvimonas gallinarii]|uniref:Subtilase family protein n=1 Tax=Pseudofulvimonas gallinarii TaxID=634155 RepID=A0A4R3LI49_9GAMM|nr:subtilase family protein [Pseudofulvimonas gallinarii]THD12512.1 hypothetical protein B1808_12300 [Pseudofulvimonas gallinarii]
MWRVVYALCVDPHGIFPATNYHATVAAITHSTDYGIEIVNQSFGGDWQDPDPCAVLQDKEPLCVALDYITTRDVVTVAASGNDRNWLNFPARDPRVVAAGGFQEGLQLWDDHPNCPNPQFDTECGSNYSYFAWNPKQEVVASARKVHGLTYPGFNWNTQYLCGDSFGPGPGNDGYGHCTGTSMSAPQVSGLFGILRSVNPLVLVGNPEQVLVQGVRNVLANTTVEAQASLPWGQHLGYGRPDAEAAVKRMLGKTAGVTVRNRATPLFAMYGPGSKDYAYTTSPQTAVALLLNQAANSSPSGAIVTGYPSFPPDPLLGPGDIPRADIFVMTTEYKTRASHPDLVPLYLFDRSRHFPVGCNPGSPSCNVHNRDYLLATGHAEVEALHAAGYSYRGLNVYVYQRCTPEPACIPEGAQKLWRKCKTADDDCALFLEGQRPGYESMGYTATLPAGYPQHIGYAYPNIDSDGDGLVDGFERLIGTSPTLFDTDGDGIGDGVEFPLASVSVADPCAGPLAWRCPADWLFANGFQP